MSATAVVEAVDALKQGKGEVIEGRPNMPSVQFCLKGFEESLDSSVVVTVALATH